VRVPLVRDEPTSDLQRMLVVADSTNGISAALPMDQWLSIPPSLTVVIRRPPVGEWFMLDAQTSIEAQAPVSRDRRSWTSTPPARMFFSRSSSPRSRRVADTYPAGGLARSDLIRLAL
jgi:hypothetical protein